MATIYRIRFNNVEEQAIECTLTDETGDLDIIDIDGAEDAVRIVSQDNDESKYSPIKAKKCVIKFLNSQAVNVRTFSIGEDNRWLVEVKINSLLVFVGHLEQGDIEEPFQYEQDQIVVLTATDGLGILKTHRLDDTFNLWTTSGGCGPNENRIIDYIANCLGASGLSLTINVINNLREIDNPATDPVTLGCIYAALYLDIKTFEDQKVGQYMYCYDVLQKIFGKDCFVTQAKGEWWVIRVTELRQDFNMTKTIFDFNGTLLSAETLNYEKSIGLKDITGTPFPTPDATAFFSQDQTMLALQRPVKYVTLRYAYENPFEVLNNATLQRGNFIADLPDELDPDGNTLTAQSFDTDCWLYERNVPPDTQDSTEYTKVLYSAGVESQRFIHMEAAANNDFYYLTSQQRIPVAFYDNFTIGCSIRYSTDLGGGSGHFQIHQIWVRLYADDGTFWNLHCVSGTGSSDPGTYWMQSDVTWGTNQRFCEFEGETENVDFTQWQTLTFPSTPCPRSGRLEILLINNQTASSQTKDFSSLSFDYIPYINGSYNIFNSQADTSTRDGIYYSAIEDEVFITNSPTPLFKGALLKPSAGQFVSVGLFYEGQQYDETTGPDHLATYGELRVRAYHNQFRNGDEIYRATCQGLGAGVIDADGADDHQDLIHRYFNRDIEPATNNQAFQLCNQDVDLRNCEWTGTLIKNFDIAIGFVNDTYTFSYGAPGTVGGGGGSGGGGGGTPPGGRFGIEDNLGVQNRDVDMQDFYLHLINIADLDFTTTFGSDFAMTASGGISLASSSFDATQPITINHSAGALQTSFFQYGVAMQGAIYLSVTRLTAAVASYDVVRTDYLITVENSTVDDVNLPDSSGEVGIPNGRVLIFKNISGGAVNINAGGSDVIYDNSGGTVVTLIVSDGKAASLMSYGNLWFQISALT